MDRVIDERLSALREIQLKAQQLETEQTTLMQNIRQITTLLSGVLSEGSSSAIKELEEYKTRLIAKKAIIEGQLKALSLPYPEINRHDDSPMSVINMFAGQQVTLEYVSPYTIKLRLSPSYVFSIEAEDEAYLEYRLNKVRKQ